MSAVLRSLWRRDAGVDQILARPARLEYGTKPGGTARWRHSSISDLFGTNEGVERLCAVAAMVGAVLVS